MPKKLILDVDTGTDDAVALMLAALHPDLELVAATTVNGNNPVEYCTDNTLRVIDLLDRDIPVFEGQATPMTRDDFPIPRAEIAEKGAMHGLELPIPPPRSAKQARRAVDFLVETYMATTEPIALVPVGPLTNIAMAIKLEPRIVERIPETIIMGGGHDRGNTTVAAEFNIWVDPEAARVVFGAGLQNLVLVPLDATHRALVSLDDCRRMRESGTPAGEAAAAFIEHRIAAYDELQPMAIAAHGARPRRPVRRLPDRPGGRDRPAPPRRHRDARRAHAGPHGHGHPAAAGPRAERVRRLRRRRAAVRGADDRDLLAPLSAPRRLERHRDPPRRRRSRRGCSGSRRRRRCGTADSGRTR